MAAYIRGECLKAVSIARYQDQLMAAPGEFQRHGLADA